MTPEARTFILKCFCRQVSAVEAAYCVNRMFDLEATICAADVSRMWDEHRETHPAMRALEDKFGERPPRGFAQCEHTRLAEELVSA